jgi:peptidase E
MPSLLLLSNSRNPGGGFLDHAEAALRETLAGCGRVLFVPFAGVTLSWDDYAERVRQRLAPSASAWTACTRPRTPARPSPRPRR